MGNIIIIDPSKFKIDFKDITAFKLINFLFNTDEHHGWEWALSEEDYINPCINLLDVDDEIKTLIILDFDMEEIRLVDFEVEIKEEIRKTRTVSIKKAKQAV